jgi:hypothetical protein
MATDIGTDRPTTERRPRTLHYHSTAGARPMSAGRVMLVGFIAFSLAALLNADSLYAQASRQPFGWKRTAARAVVAPVRELSHLIRLNEPRASIQEAIGRDAEAGTRERSRIPLTTLPPDQPPPTVAPPRVPTAAEPLRLWVGGDSMAQVFGQSLVDRSTERGTIEASLDYRISTGLTRPDYFDWPAHLVDEVLPSNPEVVVIMFGANDGQSMAIDGVAYKVRTPEWQAEYRRRVAATMDLLAGDGRLVVWVGQPSMESADFNERISIMNLIYADEAASRPWIRYLDSARVLSPAGGGYTATLPGPDGEEEQARQPDGIHLTRFAGDLLADAVLAVVDEELAAPGGSAEQGG